jgi:two-component system phosphate regulon response regulator PhoB
MRVLIVEDEVAIRDMLKFALATANYTVFELENAVDLNAKVLECKPDVMLIDWMMPKVSGISAIRELRKTPQGQSLPIIMLTAKGAEEEQVQGLEAGADDFVVKPFSPRALIARIQAVSRRSSSESELKQSLEQGRLFVDLTAHRVLVDGEQEIHLGPKEFQLLVFLMKRAERVFTRAQLLEFVWGDHVVVEDRTVDVHIRRLRKNLELLQVADYVQTVRGAGYRFSTKPMPNA